MLENGVSQRDLAKKLKVAPQTVSRFLGGTHTAYVLILWKK